MVYLLKLDSEQAELVHIAANMMHAAMDARARRMDPADMVSKAAKMSRAKCDSVMAQLDLGPLMQWPELSTERQRDILKICRAMLHGGTNDELSTYYNGLVGLVTSRDTKPGLPWHTPEPEGADLRGSTLESDPATPPQKPAKVRKRLRKTGD